MRATTSNAANEPSLRRAATLMPDGLGNCWSVSRADGADSRGLCARPSQLSEMAEAALAVKPGDRSWQETSSAVMRLRDQLASGPDAARTRDAVREVVKRLSDHGRRSVPTVAAPDEDLQRLESALTREAAADDGPSGHRDTGRARRRARSRRGPLAYGFNAGPSARRSFRPRCR